MKNQKGIIIFILIILTLSFTGCIDQPSSESKDLYSQSLGLIGCWLFEEENWDENQNLTSDCSLFDNHGTIVNTHQEINTERAGKTAIFNGSEGYIIVPSPNDYEVEEFTIQAWVKSTDPGDEFSYILSKGAQLCDLSSYALFTDSNNGICFYISDGVNTIKSPNPGSVIWDGNWHHIIGTFDESVIRIYIDGEEFQNGTQHNITINYTLSTNDSLIIGNFLGSCRLPFNGSIDDILIWDRVLSNEEIHQQYNLGWSIDDSTDTDQVTLSYVRSYLKRYLSPYSQSDIIIIKGEKLALQDNLVLTTIASQMENTEDIKRIQDATAQEQDLSDYPLLVLLGTEKTNSYTSNLISSGLFKETNSMVSPALFLRFGTHATTSQEILIVSTISEKENRENYASEKSPLSGFINKEYIPAIATATSVIFLYIWSIIGNTISEFIFDFISEHITERKIKKLRKYAGKTHLSNKRKMLHESMALVLAVIVFSLAMSWTWSSDNTEFISLIFVNLFIIALVFMIREGLRLFLSRKYTINTSHVFWPFGSILTLGSTALGNTFSLASFTMLADEKDQKLYGKMYYRIFKVLYLICLICFVLNFFYPSVFLQMTYVFIIMSLFIDMTPVEPMDGKDVKLWNKAKWTGFYIIVIVSYLIMNFSIYLPTV